MTREQRAALVHGASDSRLRSILDKGQGDDEMRELITAELTGRTMGHVRAELSLNAGE